MDQDTVPLLYIGRGSEKRRAQASSPYVTFSTLERLLLQEAQDELPRPERDHPFAAREFTITKGGKVVKNGVLR